MIAVVSGGKVCEDVSASGTSGVKEGCHCADVAALEACLKGAVERKGFINSDDSKTSWVADWVKSKLGPGISLLCMVSPKTEASNGNGFPVCVAIKSQGEQDEPSNLPHVQYLPPVRVALHCTACYAHQTPALEVYAPWLESHDLERMVQAMLESAIEQGIGSPVMLTWLDCAKEEATGSLETVTVRPGSGASAVRCLPGCPPIVVRLASQWQGRCLQHSDDGMLTIRVSITLSPVHAERIPRKTSEEDYPLSRKPFM
jgi:hypothetical protein